MLYEYYSFNPRLFHSSPIPRCSNLSVIAVLYYRSDIKKRHMVVNGNISKY
jgi:hypothetical protein